MERPDPPRLSWEPARVRRLAPRLARMFGRIALGLAAVPLAVELAAALVLPPAPAWLVAVAAWSRVAYLGAAASAVAAIVFARGVKRAGAVALEARSLFVAEGSFQWRIPRRTIEAAVVRRRALTTVDVRLASGRIHVLDLADRDRARRLAEILSGSARR